MPHRLTPDEQALLEMSDAEVDQLGVRTKKGDENARHELCKWAFVSAYDYYLKKVPSESSFSEDDAANLAHEFFLVFERDVHALRQSASHWARRVMRHCLIRFKKDARKRRPERPMATLDTLTQQPSTDPGPDQITTMHLDLETLFAVFYKHLDRLEAQDKAIIQRILLAYKEGNAPDSYSAIAEETGRTETALRVQFQRFLDRIIKEVRQHMGIDHTPKDSQRMRDVRKYLKQVLENYDARIDRFLGSVLALILLCFYPCL